MSLVLQEKKKGGVLLHQFDYYSWASVRTAEVC